MPAPPGVTLEADQNGEVVPLHRRLAADCTLDGMPNDAVFYDARSAALGLEPAWKVHRFD